MKKIPWFEMTRQYRAEQNSRNYKYTHQFIEDLLDAIERERNPFNFREQLFAITQLYIDGLIAKKYRKQKENQELTQHKGVARTVQGDALDALVQAGKSAIGSFYSGDGINCDAVRELFLQYAEYIAAYSNKECPSSRHLSGEELAVQKFGFKMQEAFTTMLDVPDTLVCNVSGALEPSYLLMYICEKNDPLLLRYSHIRRDDERVKTIDNNTQIKILPRLKKKKVLVVEDYAYTGKSIFKIVDYVVKFQPRSLYGVAVRGGDVGPFVHTRNRNGIQFAAAHRRAYMEGISHEDDMVDQLYQSLFILQKEHKTRW